MSFPKRVALAALVPALLAGCAQIREHKGYVGDTLLLDSVQPGIDNKESVAKTLGRPSFTANWDDSTWYYWARNTRQLAFGSPKPTEQLLMTVKFDRTGNVASVSRSGVETVASINPAGGKTPTLGRNRGFFAELFGNIGTVGSAGQAASTADNPN
ncbi:outer membrane protein assembly factor BamE [Sphingomonas jatrophae]|uniref:Beta-barrel assembly machine subunit BamE n=1 Tax=Sphingomonas jatrophae TaxID=1166337 RepID=A0A1I6LQ31_9SPHN|nr:outer membrane protein assembly factor BamE [Sphingomonas jatrophae]SFS05362.1 Beta-barrel assembly machine subunit BamE [Sphingomonas jatrophae]